MPVMLWTKSGGMRAVCGEVEIEVCRQATGCFTGPIRGSSGIGEFQGYDGAKWSDEPSPQAFESYVLKVLDTLSSQGRL